MTQTLAYADRSIKTSYYVPHIWYPLTCLAALGFLVVVHQTTFAALKVIDECYDPCATARAGVISHLVFLIPLWLAIPGAVWVLAECYCQPTRLIRSLFWFSLIAWLTTVAFTDFYFGYL